MKCSGVTSGGCEELAVGVWFDVKGDYQAAFVVLIFLYILAAALIGVSTPPVSQTADTPI